MSRFKATIAVEFEAPSAEAAWYLGAAADLAVERAIPGARVKDGSLEGLDPDAWCSINAPDFKEV